MREDIRLLGSILGDTVREQNGEEVFDLVERARVESFRVRRSEIDRAELARMFDGIDIHQAIPVIRAFSHFALLANVAEDIHRERRRAHSRRGRRAAAGQQPGRHLPQARCGTTRFGDCRRSPQRRAGVTGDHRASHRDPTAHGVRHAAPDHRADAAAAAWAHRDARRPRHRNRVAATDPHAVADGADPVAAVEDSGRDRSRPTVLPRRVLRGDAAGQRRGPRCAAGSLAGCRSAGEANSAAGFMDRRRPRRQSERDRRGGRAGHRQRGIHGVRPLLRRTDGAAGRAVHVGAAGAGHRRTGRARRPLP